MLNISDVLALVRAGYTADQIEAYNQPDPQPDPQPDSQPAADPQAADPPAPEQITTEEHSPESSDGHSQSPSQSQAGPAMDGLLQAIHGLASQQETLIKMLQAQNRSAAQQPGQSRETGDDIMAAMIRPKTNK